MQLNSDKINLLFPETIDWEQWKKARPDKPFSEEIIAFLNALSSSLISDSACKRYPDVITFAFFCRKANLVNLKNQNCSTDFRLGRGIVFHIAPSNVPINFAYSLVAGLLSGNYNIIRISSKQFDQVDLIIRHFFNLASKEAFKTVANRITLVQYDRSNDEATSYFSSICDARIIWGGDHTIHQIRKTPIPVRSIEVTFSDRYSFAIINADELVKETEIQKIAEGFYNDTYLFDQNACSSPHLVVWLGSKENIAIAKEKFWTKVYDVVQMKYEFQAVLSVDKLVAFYRQAMATPVHKEKTINDNILTRIGLDELPQNIEEYRSLGGYFSEYEALSIDEILPIINNKYQTLAYYGLDKELLKQFMIDNCVIGIDRIVPIGMTSNFSLTWDGYNLMTTLSRECVIL